MLGLGGSKAKVASLAVCGLLSVTLAGCGGASSDSAHGKVKLTYLLHYISKPGDGIEGDVAKQFKKKHPNVTVDVEDVQPGTEFAKFQTKATAGSPPDLYLADAATMATLVSSRVLAPIDLDALGVDDEAELESRYLPGALKAYMVDGKLYGLPSELSDYGAWMNVKAFKDAGLTPPKTWDEVCADGPKMLKEKNGKVVQAEIALPTNPPENQVPVLEALAREFGGPLFSDDGTEAFLSSQPVVDAMTMLQKLVYECHAAVPSLNGSTADADRLAFASGQADILLTAGSWYLGTLQQAGSKVAPPASQPFAYPAGPGGSSESVSYGYAWVVPAAGKNQKVAWEFAKALADAGIEGFEKHGLFNGTKAVAESDVAAKAPSWNSVWKPSLEAAHPSVSLVKGSQISVIVGNAFNDIILNQADVAKTLQSAQSKTEPLLNQK